MPEPHPVAVVVLAAGEGTRMRSRTPKVLHELAGRPMLGHVLAAARGLTPDHLLVVVGHAHEQVTQALHALDPQARAVHQVEQRGTGHAVRTALAELADLDGTVLVLPGDAPLLTTAHLQALLEGHRTDGCATSVLTAVLDDPAGYGRVLRSSSGEVAAIVEHRDADERQREVREVNTGVFAFAAAPLRAALGRLDPANAQGEEYLTDVVGLHRAEGLRVAARTTEPASDCLGVNDRLQLAEAARLLRDRINREHLLAGVALLDPATTWIDADVRLEPDATVLPHTQLRGRTVVREGAAVGPDTTVQDSEIGAGATVRRSTVEGAVVGAGATVGPYAFLRPGAVLGERSKVGAFVEVKASEIGPDSKVPHLSYVGDATIGARSNIGAATVFVNYDGRRKHRTTVGDDVRIGSDTMLVAPVEVGDGAYTAAGSVITQDVPPGALGVGRARQRNVEGWVARTRRGETA